jgi:diacylglycerol kinase family enzyme
MPTAEIPLCVYQDDHARPSVVQEVNRLAMEIPGSVRRVLRYSEPVLVENDAVVSLVVGGDGTVRKVTQALWQRNYISKLVVTRAGSHCGFYETLKWAGATVSPRDVIKNEFSQAKPYRPGIINEDPGLLILHAGVFGKIPREHAEDHRRIRNNLALPRKWPMFLAAMSSVLRRMNPDTEYSPDTIRLLLMQHRLGSFVIGIEPPVLDNNNLYLLELKAQTRAQLMTSLLVLFKEILNKKKLGEISGLTIKPEIQIPLDTGGNIDGDWINFDDIKKNEGCSQGVLYIRKIEKTIDSCALVFEKGRMHEASRER